MRTSTDDGATWSAPVRVNDDATTNSQFLPYVALDPTTGTVAVGFHDCRNDNGVPGPGGTNMIPNDDAEYFGTFSTDGGATWAPNRRLSGGFSNAAARPTASTLVTTLVCPRSRASSTRCGRTTRTAMARTRMARCTSLTCTRTHSCSRGELRRRHQLQVQLQPQRRPPPRLQRPRRRQPPRRLQPPRRPTPTRNIPHQPPTTPTPTTPRQDPLQRRGPIPHQGHVRPHRPRP